MPIDFDAFDEEIKAGEVALRVDAGLKKGEAPAPEPTPEPEAAPTEDTPADAEAAPTDETKPVDVEKPKTKTPDRIAKKLARDKQIRNLEIENARLKGVQEGQTKPAAAPETVQEAEDLEPDPTDVLSHIQWQLRKQKKEADSYKTESNKKYESLESAHKATQAEKLWVETDKNISDKNPLYSKAIKFVRDSMVKMLKEERPDLPESKIKEAAKLAEYQQIATWASPDLIEAGVISEALKMGFNVTEAATPTPPNPEAKEPVRPKTDPREVALHKKSAGSVATVPQGGGKGPLSASDIGKMDGMSDLWKLQNLDNSDWTRMAREAARKGA